MWGLINKIMLSCLEATKLSTQKSFRKLRRKERIKLRLHNTMCHACRKFDTQSTYIDHVIEKHFDEIRLDSSICLSDEKKKALQNAINQSLSNS